MRSDALDALKRAVPYIRLYRDKTFVVKVGGEALLSIETAAPLFDQIAILQALGIQIVVVHGGGPQTSELTRKLGHEPVTIEGRRVTDDAALEAVIMSINGKAQSVALSACKAVGLSAVAISGADGGLISAVRRRPQVQADGTQIDFGNVGDVTGVDASVLLQLLKSGRLPVVSPLTTGDDGKFLNINADTVAAEIAVALGAAKLIIVTGAPGILKDADDARSLVSYMDLSALDEMEASGALKAGMKPKAAAVRRALGGGVSRVHVIGSGTQDSLLVEVLTNQGCGTLIVTDASAASEMP